MQVQSVGNILTSALSQTAQGKGTDAVDALDEAARREEIALMLSGATNTDDARAAARALIG